MSSFEFGIAGRIDDALLPALPFVVNFFSEKFFLPGYGE
jgi:hypothetical protein